MLLVTSSKRLDLIDNPTCCLPHEAMGAWAEIVWKGMWLVLFCWQKPKDARRRLGCGRRRTAYLCY